MSEKMSALHEIMDALRQQRDELALQIHLGNMEAKNEFERTKKRLAKLEQEYAPLRNAVDESARGVADSVKNVGDELMESFKRIRKSLK